MPAYIVNPGKHHEPELVCPLGSRVVEPLPCFTATGPSPQMRHPWRSCGLPARPVPAPVLRDAKLHSPTTMSLPGTHKLQLPDFS